MDFSVFKVITKFIIEYILLVFCVSSFLLFDISGGIQTLLDLRNFICVSAIYGTLETIMKYNPLSNVISSVNWLNDMNSLTYRYQPSSIYLHYTYYAFFLLIGYIILLRYPFRNKMINIFSHILFIEQLFYSKSRIGWITFVVIIFFNWVMLHNRLRINRKYIRLLFCCIVTLLAVIILKPELIKWFNFEIVRRFSSFKIYGMLDGSLGQRLGTLLNYPQYMSKYPILAFFGTGSESIKTLFLSEFSYFSGYNTVDNQYLTLLVEAGLLGACLFFISIFSVVRKLWHQNDKIGITCRLFFIMFCIQAITYGLTSYFQFTIIVFVFLLWERNNSKFKD